MLFLSELAGTAILVTLGNGVVADVFLERSKGQNSGWIVITTGWGIAMMCGLFVATALGGPGWLNPAVALTALFRPHPDVAGVLAGMAGECLGGCLGAGLAYLAYLPHWRLTPYPELKLAVFVTGPGIRRPWANCLTEIIATAVFVFLLGAVGSLTKGDGLSPIIVGSCIWGVGLSLGGPTGYALNPARDLGPRIAHALLPIPGKGPSDWGYAWIPVVGPMVGGAIGWVAWRCLSSLAAAG